ncbi:MAG: cytochrome c3 family protein, partial [Pseudomonadota bacterium]
KPLSTFTDDHPNFEPSIITAVARGESGELEPTFLPRPFPKDAVLQELSGLKFPHDKHMAKDGVALLTGRQALACNDCHQTEADGNLMRPIKMERDCGGCHQMAFAPAGTAISLPHADEAAIAKIVEDYFVARIQDGAVAIQPEKTTRRRRLGNQVQKVAGNTLNASWAKEETARQLDAIFGKTLCATCHESQKVGDASTASGWLVQPALLQRHWMPRANFSHKRHEEMKCDGCHAASGSKSATDVLMPQISGCRDCHRIESDQKDELMAFLSDIVSPAKADAQTTSSVAPSTKAAPAACVTCHGFHLEDRPPVSPAHAELYQSQRTGQ